jgi:2-iminobutanoate/2-iminopropanoate deaminase
MPKKHPVFSDRAPKAIGPYVPAIRSGDLLLTSGQLGLDPLTGNLVPGGIAAETRQALQNLSALVEAAGSSLEQVLKTTVFLLNIGDFQQMNAVYAEFFPNDPPARTTVQAAALPKGAVVEIECLARILSARKIPAHGKK